MKDIYITIKSNSPEVLFKDRNSKFYGYAFPVQNEDEIKTNILKLKKLHHQAGHFCYAWYLGKSYEKFRSNDDGEPNNSAGPPILGQLQSYDVTNCLIVVVRYFGGTKLGVNGLINAYKTTAKLALENSHLEEKTIDTEFIIQFEYPLLNKVMRLIKEEELQIIEQKLELQCEYKLAVRKKKEAKVISLVKNIYGLKLIETLD